MALISKPIRKPIKISWSAPNGKRYEDIVKMTLEEYQNFVNFLNDLKQKVKQEENT